MLGYFPPLVKGQEKGDTGDMHAATAAETAVRLHLPHSYSAPLPTDTHTHTPTHTHPHIHKQPDAIVELKAAPAVIITTSVMLVRNRRTPLSLLQVPMKSLFPPFCLLTPHPLLLLPHLRHL